MSKSILLFSKNAITRHTQPFKKYKSQLAFYDGRVDAPRYRNQQQLKTALKKESVEAIFVRVEDD